MGHRPVTLFCVSELTRLNSTTRGGGVMDSPLAVLELEVWVKDYFTIVIARVALNDLVEMV